MIEVEVCRDRHSLFAGDKNMSHFPFRGSPGTQVSFICQQHITINTKTSRTIQLKTRC